MRKSSVFFNGHEMTVIINESGSIYISLKNLCSNLQLSYHHQSRKICSDALFRDYWIDVVLENDRDKETEGPVFLDVALLQAWLMTIKVCPDLQQVLQFYRKEATQEIYGQLVGERGNLSLLRDKVRSLEKETTYLEERLKGLAAEQETLGSRLDSVRQEKECYVNIMKKLEREVKKSLKVVELADKDSLYQNIFLTERDLNILKALFRNKTLTVSQINKKYFVTSRIYCYKRMKEIERAGYVVNRTVRGRICYFLTKLGAEEIGVRHEPRWMQETWKLPRLIELSLIFLELEQAGWECLNSRESKRKFNLNRNSRLDGSLKFGNTEYLFYYLDKQIGPKTIKAIQAEIRNHSRFGLSRYIILHRSNGWSDLFEKTCGSREMMVMPYETGFELVKIFPNINELLEKNLGGRLIECNRFFARYLIKIEDREYYVAPLMTNDLVMKHYLREYTLEEARRDGRGVFAVLLESQEHFLDSAVYPHIKFVTVSI